WLGNNPHWDPRIRLASSEQTNYLRQQYARQSQQPMAGYPMAGAESTLLGEHEFGGLYGQISQKNGLCMAASGLQLDLALARMNWSLALLADEVAEEEKKKKEQEEQEKEAKAKEEADKEQQDKDGEKPAEEKSEQKPKSDEEEKKAAADATELVDAKEITPDMLDGIPEWFVGPLLADLVAHEVGHTLGLRHNFKASAALPLDKINSNETKGKKTITASVMDYTPVNYRYEAGEIQGDYGMTGIGPYDFWAIEYGYTFDEKKLPEILKRCSEPELQYATDEDGSGRDPLAMRYDFSANPLDYAQERMKQVRLYRDRSLDDF